jgi:hypothetical protein
VIVENRFINTPTPVQGPAGKADPSAEQPVERAEPFR